jgi:hypothetical protein
MYALEVTGDLPGDGEAQYDDVEDEYEEYN